MCVEHCARKKEKIRPKHDANIEVEGKGKVYKKTKGRIVYYTREDENIMETDI